MGLWSKLFGKASETQEPEPPAAARTQAEAEQPQVPPSFGDALQEVLVYLQEQRAGAPPAPDFERESLANDLGFDTLDLAELIATLAVQKGRSPKEVASRMRGSGVRIPGAEDYDDDHGGKSSLANLVERSGILLASFPKAEERRTLLAGGVVGPGNEVRPFSPQVTVGFIVKYVRSLGL